MLVILNDPAERPPPRTAVLREAFGLTPAETDVALLFTEGHSLREIADRRRVALGTTQNQIKALMSKIGASRQAEMMRMLQAFCGHPTTRR